MCTKSNIFFILLILVFNTSFSQSEIITYPSPTENFSAQSDKFLVTLYKNESDKKGYESFVYVSKSGEVPKKELAKNVIGKTFNYTIFSFSGKVIVEVTKLNSDAKYATVKSSSLGSSSILTQKNSINRKVRFTLNSADKVSVNFDDDPNINAVMMLFANTIENTSDIPTENSSNVLVVKSEADITSIQNSKTVVYFPAGVFETGYWSIPPFVKQIYVSGGAFVRGYFYAKRNNSNPLKINGRGILSNDIYPFHNPENNTQNMSSSKNWYKLVQIDGGKNHLIEGVTLVDGSAYYILLNADSSFIDNVNIQGFKYNNDGITILGKFNTIRNSFIYLNEDAIIDYCNSIQIYKNTFWQLENVSIIQLGWRPNKIGGTNLIENCTVLQATWASTSQDGAFISAINSVPANNTNPVGVENFTVNNITFYSEISKFLDIRMNLPGRQKNTFNNFNFSNIHFAANQRIDQPVIFLGDYDDDNKIKAFTFNDFFIDRRKISDDKKQNLFSIITK